MGLIQTTSNLISLYTVQELANEKLSKVLAKLERCVCGDASHFDAMMISP